MTTTATLTTVRVFGALAAFTGVEHGLGEISQGPGRPPALVFESWPHAAAFEPLDGEPAMSLIPDLLVSGALSVVVALVLGGVALRYPHCPHSGLVLFGLSLVLLLVGGGFGPPLVGALAGLLATRVNAPVRRPGPRNRLGAGLWPWPLLAATTCFLGLVPGTALLHALTGETYPAFVSALTLGAFAATALAIVSARAWDRAQPTLHHPTPLRKEVR